MRRGSSYPCAARWTAFLLATLIASSAFARVQLPGEEAVRTALEGNGHPGLVFPDASRWRDALLELYASRAFAPLWFTERTLTEPAAALLSELRDAERRALRSHDYDGLRLTDLASGLAVDRQTAPEEVLFVDVALSLNAARFVSDLHAGRVAPRDVGFDLDVPHAQLDVGTALLALAATADTPTVLDDYEPGLRHYALLKSALARYRELASSPEPLQLPPLPGRSVKPGERYEGTPVLRAWLSTLQDLPAEPGTSAGLEDVLGPALVEALIRFQVRHGLSSDGVLGPRTFAALTTALQQRVNSIELSLERMRWLPPKLGTPPVIVNIPQFRLFAFHTTEDVEEQMLQMRVIVGQSFPRNRTPVFAADMRYIVLRPFWDVPYSILVRELLPLIRANPGWVARNGYEIVSGQGDNARPQPVTPETVEALARGALRLRQRPGPNSALGPVKFVFPNRYNVYLHGTPAQALFAEARRAFSHGCVRVEDPMALIDYVLRDQPEWTRERILQAIAGGRPTRIDLTTRIRVFILYATALATESGSVLFFDDIYGHDARLAALLDARSARLREWVP